MPSTNTLLIIFACISFVFLICAYMLKVYLLSACCLLAFVIFIIFLLTHKDDKDNNTNKYNWTDAQKTELDSRIYDTKDPLPLSIKNCIRNAIISNISYDDFKSQSFDKVMFFIIKKVQCLGTIGNWDNDYKNYIESMLEIKFSKACTNCIIDSLEKILDPVDAIAKVKDITYLENIIINNCSSECSH